MSAKCKPIMSKDLMFFANQEKNNQSSANAGKTPRSSLTNVNRRMALGEADNEAEDIKICAMNYARRISLPHVRN